MLLAIDARNRSVTVGFHDGEHWRAVRHFGAAAERSADEYALLVKAVWDSTTTVGTGDSVESAWISSVVPALTPRLVEALHIVFGVDATVIGPGVRSGLKIRTDVPSEVGSDLVCAAVAARALIGGACIIVDFGASLTFSALNSQGEFMGVSIAPGIMSAAESLRNNAAQIPEVRLEMPERAIGKTTAQAIQSGILLGYGGLVSRLVELIRGELGEQAELIGSGDATGKIILESCGPCRFVQDLVLEGLAIMARRIVR